MKGERGGGGLVARALSRTHMSTTSKEESLFKADAVNEEDPERDCRRRKVYSKLAQ